MNKKLTLAVIVTILSFFFFAQKAIDKRIEIKNIMEDNMAIATFGNGCFWCTEAIFQQLKGVKTVMPGYTGGKTQNPTYYEVCTGFTGHAEVIQITYDPEIVSYRELLEIFFYTHDPTTLNRQGNDVGTQYRSAIYYHNKDQKKEAQAMIEQLELEKVYDDKIVTEISRIDKFYFAEDYHKNYYNNNKNEGYCRAVINPKLDKFVKKYKSKIKE